jgi:hypothetical protein
LTNGREEKLDRNSDAVSGTIFRDSVFKEAFIFNPFIFVCKKDSQLV